MRDFQKDILCHSGKKQVYNICEANYAIFSEYISWFKFYFSLNFLKPFWFFSFVSDYDYNENKRKKTKNQSGLKNFKPRRKNLQ